MLQIKKGLALLFTLIFVAAMIPVDAMAVYETESIDGANSAESGYIQWKYVNYPFAIDVNDRLYAIGSIPGVLQSDGSVEKKGSIASPLMIADNVKSASYNSNDLSAHYISNDNVLFGWGNLVGDGTTMLREIPVLIAEDVASLPDYSARYHYVRKTDDTLLSWGSGVSIFPPSYLGDYNIVHEAFLAPVPAHSDYAYYKTTRYTFHELDSASYMLLDRSGMLYKYKTPDYNYLGEQVGYNQENISDENLVVELFMADVAAVTMKGDFSDATTYILKKNGTLLGWGSNDFCELGDGTNQWKDDPIQILDNVVEFKLGYFTAYALRSDGTLWAWGDNRSNAVGEGTDRRYIDTPVQVLSDVVSFSSYYYGGTTALAVKSDGTLWQWGTGSSTPVQVGAPI